MSISSSQLTTLVDNVSKSIVDLEASLITNVGANSPTSTTITNGQFAASNSLSAHISALAVADQAGFIGTGWLKSANKVNALINFNKNSIYALFEDFLIALEKDLGGLYDSLWANSVQVHPEFQAAFNYIASQENIPGTYEILDNRNMDLIPPTLVFPATETSLASIAVTGAAAGTFSAGTAIDTTKYASQELWLKNTAGGATGGTATSFTVTYKDINNTTQTVTKALSGSLASGAYLDLGVIGQSVSNIVVNSGGVAADAIAVVAKLLRTIAY